MMAFKRIVEGQNIKILLCVVTFKVKTKLSFVVVDMKKEFLHALLTNGQAHGLRTHEG